MMMLETRGARALEDAYAQSLAECERLRAALAEVAGDLRGRCEPGSTALHCYNVATAALREVGAQ
jgi:hypothetical protein